MEGIEWVQHLVHPVVNFRREQDLLILQRITSGLDQPVLEVEYTVVQSTVSVLEVCDEVLSLGIAYVC